MFVSSTSSLGAEPNSPAGAPRQKKVPPVALPLLPLEQAWIALLDAQPSAPGVMDADRIYVPIQPEEIVALDRATGAKVWTHDVETNWPPVLGGDTLYIAASDEIHALDPATGQERWRVPYDKPMIAPLVAVVPDGIRDQGSGIRQAQTTLIGVFDKGTVIAFAADDGRRLWTQELGSPTHFVPVSDGTRAFFALDDSRGVSLKLADGSRAWELKLDGTLNQPSRIQDRVFIGTNTNLLYAIDSDNGRIAWRWRAGGDVLGISGDTKGGLYYASLDNVLRSVNRSNGNQRWIKEIPTRPVLPPQTYGDSDNMAYTEIVLLTGVTSEVDAFDAKNGMAIGMYMPPSDLEGAPLVDPVLRPYRVAMVVITRDGRAVGLRPTAMMLAEPTVAPLTSELPGRKLERERITPPTTR
jgi:outer membrane protein assembly factor BamB